MTTSPPCLESYAKIFEFEKICLEAYYFSVYRPLFN